MKPIHGKEKTKTNTTKARVTDNKVGGLITNLQMTRELYLQCFDSQYCFVSIKKTLFYVVYFMPFLKYTYLTDLI